MLGNQVSSSLCCTSEAAKQLFFTPRSCKAFFQIRKISTPGMSSCPKECGPRGDVIPTPGPEEPADLAPRAHYSCLKSDEKTDSEEVVVTASGESSEQELENTTCEEAEGENTKPEEEEEDEDKQKRKEIENSSLFNIADATSDHMKIVSDAQLQAPITSDIEKLVKLRSLKLSPNKSPRGEPLQQATHDNDRASS